jgi:SSS family solute:Na+ symporter
MHLSVGQLFPFLPDTAKDVNIGFVALALNIIVFVVVSAVTQPRSSGQSHAQTHVH